jgi:hypothetical protein
VTLLTSAHQASVRLSARRFLASVVLCSRNEACSSRCTRRDARAAQLLAAHCWRRARPLATRRRLRETFPQAHASSHTRSAVPTKVLALQVESCSPRLIASRVDACWRPSGFGRGSGRRASANQSTPLSRLPHRRSVECQPHGGDPQVARIRQEVLATHWDSRARVSTTTPRFSP